MIKFGFRVLLFYTFGILSGIGFILIQPVITRLLYVPVTAITKDFSPDQVEIFEVAVAVILAWYITKLVWEFSGYFIEGLTVSFREEETGDSTKS